MITYVIDGINPEPWTAPLSSVGRKGGRYITHHHSPEQMKTYQLALKAEFDRWVVDKWEGELFVQFKFWRQVAEFETELGHKSTANYADVTNLQKSTEDALQGILYDNDRQVRRIGSEIVAQGPEVIPCIRISIKQYEAQSGTPESYRPRSKSPSSKRKVSPTKNENVLPADRDIF